MYHLLVTVADELYIASARLYLRSFYFFDTSSTEMCKRGVLSAYNAAVDLVTLLSRMDGAQQLLSYLPSHFFRTLFTATGIMLKVLRSSYVTEVADLTKGKKAYNQALVALSRCSVENHDSAGKGGKIMAQLWRGDGTYHPGSPPTLRIKSRLGAR